MKLIPHLTPQTNHSIHEFLNQILPLVLLFAHARWESLPPFTTEGCACEPSYLSGKIQLMTTYLGQFYLPSREKIRKLGTFSKIKTPFMNSIWGATDTSRLGFVESKQVDRVNSGGVPLLLNRLLVLLVVVLPANEFICTLV